MRVSARRFIPVLIAFPEEEDRREGWGRLLELRPDGARLVTRAKVERGGRLRLGFELPGESFSGLEALVVRSGPDPDGWSMAELRFPSVSDRLLLGRVLRGILAAG